MKDNKMSFIDIKKLIWTMGLPMIVSMVLQAVYNVVDTIFVINSSAGTYGNLALTQAFPIQILIIAIGVGTGVGINAMLSKNLGEGNRELVNKVAGNGIILAFFIYILFLLFGIFGAKPYMELMSSDAIVIDYGTSYLRICCCLSFGSIGYTVYERFLQATGKTAHSMIAQISGALTNIVLDAVFIFIFKWGVEGAAWATVIGQFISLFVAMALHYGINKEISGNIKYIKGNKTIIMNIYKIGLPAAIMQALLAVMMFVVLLIIKSGDVLIIPLLTNTYGIYYKIMQMALFALFGLSNTLITITSFNYGLKNKERVNDTIKWGIIDSVIVAVVITILFQLFAKGIASLFGLSLPEVGADGILREDVISSCERALHIATLGYVFMGLSVGIQGILQGFRNIYKPVIISFLRLIVFVVPFAFLFIKSNNSMANFWWTFPIAEFLAAIFSIIFLIDSIKRLKYESVSFKNNIITISRLHGAGGKAIAKGLSMRLGYTFYDKENYILDVNDENVYETYQSKNFNPEAIVAQAEQIKKIASKGNAIICGRCADYFLRDEEIIKIFIKADIDFRVKRIMEIYNDTELEAINNIKRSDRERKEYYEKTTGLRFGDKKNYTFVFDSTIGIEQSIDELSKLILEKIKNK